MLTSNILFPLSVVLPIKEYEPEIICLILKKGKHRKKAQNHNENHTIRFSISENPVVVFSSFYMQKCGILYFFLPKGSFFMFIDGYLFLLIC